MTGPPNEKGIMNAMKSMKTIASKESSRGGLPPAKAVFPSPPIEFVGTTEPKKRTKTNASPNPKTKKKSHSAPNPKTKKKSSVSLSPPQPPTPLPPVKPNTNSQLFGTLVNSLKTGPVGQMHSVGRGSKTPARKNFAKGGKQSTNKKKAYASSSSSSSLASVSTSSSNAPSVSSASSRSSESPSEMVSSASSGSYSSAAKPGKVAREK
ncbi:unnamed protein product [Ectocarpus sp. 12 AP-2014]